MAAHGPPTRRGSAVLPGSLPGMAAQIRRPAQLKPWEGEGEGEGEEGEEGEEGDAGGEGEEGEEGEEGAGSEEEEEEEPPRKWARGSESRGGIGAYGEKDEVQRAVERNRKKRESRAAKQRAAQEGVILRSGRAPYTEKRNSRALQRTNMAI